jgi:predicted nucleic acid-binding protein
MIYLVSCLVIYLLEQPETRGAQVKAAMALHAEEEFATSWLVYLECLVGPLASGDAVAQRGYEQALDQLSAVPLGRAVFIRATRLRATSRLRTPDAIHLAAALESGCSALWTNDDRFGRVADGSLVVNVLGR